MLLVQGMIQLSVPREVARMQGRVLEAHTDTSEEQVMLCYTREYSTIKLVLQHTSSALLQLKKHLQ